MILVTLGTQDKSFIRLLEIIEKQMKKGKIQDEVIVQAGCTKYESKYMQIFDYIPFDQFDDLMARCDLLITHGGVGSIIAGLKQNKKIIAAPRLKKYKEHTNDHQLQIVEEFAKRGYLLALKDFSKLDQLIKKSQTFQPKKFESNTKHVEEMIASYIDQLS